MPDADARLVECVPNFSEGRDPDVIGAIAEAIAAVPGSRLLHVDPGAGANRTVVTFAGEPEAALDAAFAGIRTAARHIDMRDHQGVHPRIGATDVCPFVPLQGTTMADCADLARRLGERVGRELGIPVYLYGEAASRPERRGLGRLRWGQYEGLRARLADPWWAPDFGPVDWDDGVARAGATVIGARFFLVALNVTLETIDVGVARRIARRLRERGEVRRHPNGTVVRDADGRPLRTSGRFRHLKAIGWLIPEYGRAQVSMNLTDFRETPMHAVVSAVREEAGREGVHVAGSELVGLVPLDAMRAAGRASGLPADASDRELVAAAAGALALDRYDPAHRRPFDPDERVLEWRLAAVPPTGT
jgi:glutamate formiminotransferase